MKAMVLAAGFGKRMLPLTNDLPKPLLAIKDKPMIEYHIEALVASGVSDIVINHAHLGGKLETALGDGERFGIKISYSKEQEPLETAGGIIKALPLLGDDPFIVVNGDVWTDYPFQRLFDKGDKLAHLVMVNNPEHNPVGDFLLRSDGLLQSELSADQGVALTFSGISLLSPQLFEGFSEGALALKKPLLDAMQKQQVSAEHYIGNWTDVGTPQRLAELNQ